MTDDAYHGIFSVLVFGALSALGAIIFSVALMVTMLSKVRNQKPLKLQPGFGFLLGSLIPFITGLVCMYAVAIIHSVPVRAASDSYGCFIVMVLALAAMLYVARRWKYRYASSSE